MNRRRQTGAILIGESRRQVVICAMARSPFGRFNGALADIDATHLAAQVIDALLVRAKIDPQEIDALYNGVGLAGAAMLSVTRQIVLRSTLHQATPSMGVDRACCSGMTAIAQAARDVATGLQDVAIAGGVESLSNMPVFMPRRHGVRPGAMQLIDPLILGGSVVDRPIAAYSGEEALRFGVGREAQDQWACESHRRYFKADAAGCFDAERVPIKTGGRHGDMTHLARDESPRADSDIARLASLKTVYASPTVTAGNAPGLSDGAAYVLVTTQDTALQKGWPILGRVVAYSQVAGGPTSGTSTPAVALQQVLDVARLGLDDLVRLEINEAYAATPLVSTKVLAGDNREQLERLRALTNPWGGAVALGHPLGASGARLVMTVLSDFLKQGKGSRYGAAAICGGFGQGDALLLASA